MAAKKSIEPAPAKTVLETDETTKRKRAKKQGTPAHYRVKDPTSPTGFAKRTRVFPSKAVQEWYLHDLWRKGELWGSPEPRMFAELVAHFQDLALDGRIKGVLKSYILPRWGHVRLADVTPEAIEQLYYELSQTRAAETRNAVMSKLEELFNHAINLHTDESYWLVEAENPMRQIALAPTEEHRNERARKRRSRPLPLPTLDHLARIVFRATGRIRTIFLLAIFAGLRGQEIRALQYGDIVLFSDRVEIHITRAIKKATNKTGPVKTNAGRRFIIVGGLLLEHFRELLRTEREPHELVVCEEAGGVIEYFRFWAMVHEFQVSVGIGERLGPQSFLGSFGIHMYRHAAVALWIWAGMEDQEISRMLGHKAGDLQLSLERYGYLFEAQMNNPYEWPAGDMPMTIGEADDILLELEDA